VPLVTICLVSTRPAPPQPCDHDSLLSLGLGNPEAFSIR
jgi:hypothetical protein